MTSEQYFTAFYYIGICFWLFAFIYIAVSAKELAHDHGKKVHVANVDINDALNMFYLIRHGDTPKVKVSATVHLSLIILLLLIPILYFG